MQHKGVEYEVVQTAGPRAGNGPSKYRARRTRPATASRALAILYARNAIEKAIKVKRRKARCSKAASVGGRLPGFPSRNSDGCYQTGNEVPRGIGVCETVAAVIKAHVADSQSLDSLFKNKRSRTIGKGDGLGAMS